MSLYALEACAQQRNLQQLFLDWDRSTVPCELYGPLVITSTLRTLFVPYDAVLFDLGVLQQCEQLRELYLLDHQTGSRGQYASATFGLMLKSLAKLEVLHVTGVRFDEADFVGGGWASELQGVTKLGLQACCFTGALSKIASLQSLVVCGEDNRVTSFEELNCMQQVTSVWLSSVLVESTIECPKLKELCLTRCRFEGEASDLRGCPLLTKLVYDTQGVGGDLRMCDSLSLLSKAAGRSFGEDIDTGPRSYYYDMYTSPFRSFLLPPLKHLFLRACYGEPQDLGFLNQLTSVQTLELHVCQGCVEHEFSGAHVREAADKLGQLKELKCLKLFLNRYRGSTSPPSVLSEVERAVRERAGSYRVEVQAIDEPHYKSHDERW